MAGTENTMEPVSPDKGPGSGLYKSTDEGVTWNEIDGHGLPTKPYGRIGIAVEPAQAARRFMHSFKLLEKGRVTQTVR